MFLSILSFGLLTQHHSLPLLIPIFLSPWADPVKVYNARRMSLSTNMASLPFSFSFFFRKLITVGLSFWIKGYMGFLFYTIKSEKKRKKYNNHIHSLTHHLFLK